MPRPPHLKVRLPKPKIPRPHRRFRLPRLAFRRYQAGALWALVALAALATLPSLVPGQSSGSALGDGLGVSAQDEAAARYQAWLRGRAAGADPSAAAAAAQQAAAGPGAAAPTPTVIPPTWQSLGRDGNGDGIANPNNLFDAAVSAAGYLCLSGGGPLSDQANLRRAIYAYNHSVDYVNAVIAWANFYLQHEGQGSLLEVQVPAGPSSSIQPGVAAGGTGVATTPGGAIATPSSAGATTSPTAPSTHVSSSSSSSTTSTRAPTTAPPTTAPPSSSSTTTTTTTTSSTTTTTAPCATTTTSTSTSST